MGVCMAERRANRKDGVLKRSAGTRREVRLSRRSGRDELFLNDERQYLQIEELTSENYAALEFRNPMHIFQRICREHRRKLANSPKLTIISICLLSAELRSKQVFGLASSLVALAVTITSLSIFTPPFCL